MYGYRMVVSILTAHCHDRVINWDLWLSATAQHHIRVSYCISQLQKRTKFKIWSIVSTECIMLLHQCFRSKNHKLNHSKLGTTYTYKKKVSEKFWLKWVYLYSSVSDGFFQRNLTTFLLLYVLYISIYLHFLLLSFPFSIHLG